MRLIITVIESGDLSSIRLRHLVQPHTQQLQTHRSTREFQMQQPLAEEKALGHRVTSVTPRGGVDEDLAKERDEGSTKGCGETNR